MTPYILDSEHLSDLGHSLAKCVKVAAFSIKNDTLIFYVEPKRYEKTIIFLKRQIEDKYIEVRKWN